jgi:hypothetical protein
LLTGLSRLATVIRKMLGPFRVLSAEGFLRVPGIAPRRSATVATNRTAQRFPAEPPHQAPRAAAAPPVSPSSTASPPRARPPNGIWSTSARRTHWPASVTNHRFRPRWSRSSNTAFHAPRPARAPDAPPLPELPRKYLVEALITPSSR